MNDFERRKFYSAQRIFRNREADEQTPSRECTWREWWRLMYHEDLDEYAKRARREGIRAKVEATYEAKKTVD